MNMTPEQSYRLAVVSNAPISSTNEAKFKGAWLLETAQVIERECQTEQERVAAEAVPA